MRFREILNLYDTTNVRVGHVSTDNLSNELDSITVVLTNVPYMAIENNDIVDFTDENNNRRCWLVGNVNKTYMTFKQPFLYEYTVDLISPTKLLEMPIPSQAITYRDEPNRDLWSYIKRTYLRYFKLKGRYEGMIVSYDAYIPFSTLRAYNNGHAPESTIEKPTLREYLDFLFNFIGYISQLEIKIVQPNANVEYATLSYYVVSLKGFNLNLSGNQISSDYAVEIHESKQGENYITCLEQNMDEVITPNPVVEKLRLKTEEPVVNEENARLLTSYKLYDLKKLSFVASKVDNQYMDVTYLKEKTGDYGVDSFLHVTIGAPESILDNNYSTTYEIVTVSQDEETIWVWSCNWWDFDSTHRSYGNYRKRVYTKIGNTYVLSEETYTSASTPQKLVDYKFLLLRNFGNENVGKDDYLIISATVLLDITSYAFIEEIYQTLERVEAQYVSYGTHVKNNSLSWKRGSREINGLLSYETRTGLFNVAINSVFAIRYILQYAAYDYGVSYFNSLNSFFKSYSYDINEYSFSFDYVSRGLTPESVTDFYILDDGDTEYTKILDNENIDYKQIKNWVFLVEYLAYASFKIECEKPEYRHRITSMDSNTNSSTDVLSEIKRSKEKVKQLANSNLILNAFSTGSTPVMAIGDYMLLEGNTKYTLISLETKHDGTSLLYKGILSKNYSNQVINTIINREKRYYSLPDPSSAVTRHEKIEYTISGINNSTGFNIKCNYALVRIKVLSQIGTDYLMKYCILPITSIFSADNNRITYTLDFLSNSIYGYKPTNDNILEGKKVKVCKYTDEYAEVTDLQVMFIYMNKNTADDTTYDQSVLVDDIENIVTIFDSHLPVINLNLNSNNFLKDAREHLVVSLDLKFNTLLADDIEAAFESDYDGNYNKFDITT